MLHKALPTLQTHPIYRTKNTPFYVRDNQRVFRYIEHSKTLNAVFLFSCRYAMNERLALVQRYRGLPLISSRETRLLAILTARACETSGS
jgi:hypothetical protein